MITYLIFKRQELVDGSNKVVTKVVPVDVPDIKSGEGWILSGHTDIINVVSSNTVEQSEKSSSSEDSVTKFNSNVSGTAKLVRMKGVIKIVARRGKKTYNETTPNSVCIDEYTKNEFFKHCRDFHGNVGLFEFAVKDGRPYDLWNTRIDTIYSSQKQQFLKNNR
jgi:hypothetical protein